MTVYKAHCPLSWTPLSTPINLGGQRLHGLGATAAAS